MNAATLDFQHFEDKKSSQQGKVCLQRARDVHVVNKLARDDAYWAKRADELFSVHVDESLPTASGKFGTFLY